ncbi:MAG: NuoM family protein [Halobacteria archaeon]
MTEISLLIAIPMIAGILTWLTPRFLGEENAGYFAFVASLVPLAISVYVWFVPFEQAGNALTGGAIQLEEKVTWIEAMGYKIQYFVGMDGISMPLVLLTTLLITVAIMSAWPAIDERRNQFYGLVLLLEGGLIGVFTSLDFLLFYVFWEMVLIPMYFLVAVWGGPKRKYAAMKFFVYTNIASLLMFIGVMALYFNAGVKNLSMVALTEAVHSGELAGAFGLSAHVFQIAAFVALFVGFAVKVPMVPFHTWLPDAHVQAPTPVSVILAGVLLKMGTYALLRFNFTILSEVAIQFSTLIAIAGAASVIYGALLAMAQTDLKRIVAYSSISSMGYVVIGLAAYTEFGVGGATFQMISHGLISGLMFMVVGVVYHNTHTRSVHEMSGIVKKSPMVAGVFVVTAFGYMGLPGMSGFAGELFVFLGGMSSDVMAGSQVVVPVAMFGIVLVAGYLLFAMQRTMFGTYDAPERYKDEVGDASLSEAVPLFVLLIVIIALGLQPDVVFDMIQQSSTAVVELAGGV